MRIFILTFLVLTFIQITPAQKVCKALIDSLYAELPKMKDDTNKVRALANICFEMRYVNVQKGLEPGLAALHLAEKLHDQVGQGLSHMALATCYGNLSNLPERIDHNLKASLIFETLRNPNLLCYSYGLLATGYKSLDSIVSQKYLAKAMALLPQTNITEWKIRNYGNLGNFYRSNGQLDSAMKYISISQKLSEQKHLPFEIMMAKTRLAAFYWWEEDPEKLNSYFMLFKTALEYFKAVGATRMVTENSSAMGEIRLRQLPGKGPLRKQYLADAFYYAQESLKSAEEIRYMAYMIHANFQLHTISRIEKKYEKALDYLEKAYALNDSINQPEIVNKASVLSWKYEQELKEQQMELLKLKNRQQLILILASAACLVILIIVIIVIISNRRRLKKAYNLVNHQKEEIECQKEEVETQKKALEDTLDKLKQTQSQLIQSEKMASLGMLTAGIAHEINNPVNFINSGAISLEKDYEDLQQIIQSIEQHFPGAQKLAEELGIDELQKIIPQTIEDIKTGVQRTSEIVKGLRNFTRLDASELKEADIHEGIDSTLLLLSHKLKDRIRVVKEYDDQIGFIKCYPGPLNQVFMNLLNNAIDAIDQKIKEDSSSEVSSDIKIPGGNYQISITTKLVGEEGKTQVKIVISDTGVGIPDEIRDKLFDPFFTTKEVGKGTGLGLAICHGIIDKHGGSITFESKVNEGSVFTIILTGA